MADALPQSLVEALAGRYRILREVGAGGMATVYLAEDVRHSRRVAIKVLRQELSSSLGADRFLREISIAANLQHPHVLPLYDSGESAGALYYVMPFVEGNTLRERLARERELPIGDAVRILREVADAMSAAHAKGVVHRDLKPENIMLSGRHALVADFGVAKAVSESTGRVTLTTVGVALGTPAYMAPEQASADPLTDHRADLYALGVIAYEMLTGETPFVRATPQAMLAAHVMDRPTLITEKRAAIPAALATIVMQCLEKKPADRPQSADDVLSALEMIGSQGATSSGGITPRDTQPFAAVSPAGTPPVTSGVAAPAAAPPVVSPTIAASTPRSRRLLSLVGAVLVVAAIGAAFVTRNRWMTPATNSRVRTPIAVVPFDVRVSDATLRSLGVDAADRISAEMQKAGFSGVVSAREVKESAFTESNARAAASATRAATLVFGTVSQRGSEVEIEARVVRAADQITLWVLGPERAPMADAARAVAAITERTVAATGYYLSPTSETVVNAGLVRPPATLAVLRLLEQAEKVFRGGDNTGAIPLLRAVLQADSLLPQPRFLLVAALRNVGGKQALEAESLMVSMRSRRSGMLPLDAAFTDIAVAWFASPESEYEAALALGKVDSVANPYLMMLAASRARHPREALRLYGRRDTTTLFGQTWRSWQTVAAQSYHQLGEYQQELELARSARRRDSRGVGYWTAEARALEALGRTDSLERLITESASLERADGTVQVIYGAMLEADYHRRPEAKRLAERVRAALAILPDSFGNATGGRNMERAALRVLGDYRGVIALYDRENSAALGAEGRLLAARYRILLGDTVGVGAIIDAAKSAPLSVYSTWGTIAQPLYYRAQLLAMMGRKDEAVASLREALNRGYRLGVDDELQLFWDNVRDYPPFVELTKLR